jgi:predicted secreted protein
MSLTGALAIFFIIWWVVLFTVLPWGVRTQQEDGEVVPGTVSSAPSRPSLIRKMAITTVIAAAIFAIFYVVYTNGLVSLDSVPLPPTDPSGY